MKMRAYEITIHPSLKQRVYQGINIVLGRVILTTLESDGLMRIFCAAKSSLPEVLDSLGGVTALKDITEQIIDSRTQYHLWTSPLMDIRDFGYFGT